MSKSPLHNSIVKRLYDLIAAVLPEAFVVHRDNSLKLAGSELHPDITIMRAIPRGYETEFLSSDFSTAELVIEIAGSDPGLEREHASLYAQNRVSEYWIILPGERQVEVYRRRDHGRYQETTSFGAEDIVQCLAVPAVRVRLADLLAGEDRDQ